MKKTNVSYIVLIALLIATSMLSLKLYLTEKSAHDKLDISIFPYQMGEWNGRDLPVTEKEYKILETRNLISREYVNSSGEKLFLFIIYSETNRAVFHPPEVCLIGSGMAIADKTIEKVGVDRYSFLTNKLDLEKDGFKEVVLNCYKAGKLYTANFYLQQAYLILHQAFGRPVAGATIRVSMPVRADEARTLAVLKSFLGETVKIVDKLASS